MGKDINIDDLKKMLDEIKSFYEKISSIYSVGEDLINTSEKCEGVSLLINNHLETNQKKYDDLFNKISAQAEQSDKIIAFGSEIQKLHN